METTLLAADAAIIGGIFGGVAIFMILFYLLLVIAGWKILKKAGEPGWKILIPIYNIYIMFKIVGMQNWFWISIVVGLISNLLLSASGLGKYTTEELQTLSITPMIIIALIAGIVNMVVDVYISVTYAIRTSRAFGHGLLFAFGLFFLPNIFWLIIGFGRSKYSKKYLKK